MFEKRAEDVVRDISNVKQEIISYRKVIKPERYLPETVGAGCVFFDYDNDGWMDIYLVNSGTSDFFTPAKPLKNALYHNNHDGTFTDVTDKAGVAGGTFGMGGYLESGGGNDGYYFGFANEGLWPLCHIAHVRPVFRTSDWEQYVEVNRRFSAAVCSEARTEDPVVLVQDYHFALLPRFIHEQLPKATIITFWQPITARAGLILDLLPSVLGGWWQLVHVFQ